MVMVQKIIKDNAILTAGNLLEQKKLMMVNVNVNSERLIIFIGHFLGLLRLIKLSLLDCAIHIAMQQLTLKWPAKTNSLLSS